MLKKNYVMDHFLWSKRPNYVIFAKFKGLLIKTSAVEGSLSSSDKEKVSSSDADVRTFWCKKASDFSEFLVCMSVMGDPLSFNTQHQ